MLQEFAYNEWEGKKITQTNILEFCFGNINMELTV